MNRIPNELLEIIARYCDKIQDCAALAQTCRHIHAGVNPILYHRNEREYGNSVIVWAVTGGNIATLKRTIEYSLDFVGLRGGELLNLAALRAYDEVLQLLIDEAGFDPKQEKSDMNGPPISVAIENRQLSTVRLLLEKGVDTNAPYRDTNRPLGHAASIDAVHIVQCLLNHGADINLLCKDGNTAFHEAISAGAQKSIQLLLLKYEPDLSLANNSGQTALHLAALINDSDLVYTLLSRGADINAQDNKNQDALGIALQKENTNLAKHLLGIGATGYLHPQNRQSLLVRAASRNKTEQVKLLLDHGRHEEYMKEDLYRALGLAATRGHSEICEMLIAVGLDVNQPHNNRPLCRAVENGHIDTIQLFLDHGADVNLSDDGSRQLKTPLIMATGRLHTEAVRLLVQQDEADLEARDSSGKTALAIAMEIFWSGESGVRDIIDILIDHGAQQEFAPLDEFRAYVQANRSNMQHPEFRQRFYDECYVPMLRRLQDAREGRNRFESRIRR